MAEKIEIPDTVTFAGVKWQVKKVTNDSYLSGEIDIEVEDEEIQSMVSDEVIYHVVLERGSSKAKLTLEDFLNLTDIQN
jgi:hypothetical protein